MLALFFREDFWIGFFGNFFSTLIAGWILYLLLERSFNKNQEKRERNRLLRNLTTEIIANWIVAHRIVENIPESLTSTKFPISHFKYTHINNFMYTRPLENEAKLYIDLTSLALNFEQTNYLTDLVFSKTDSDVIIGNKVAVNNSATKLLEQINKLLVKLSEINKSDKFMDEIEKPKDTNKI